MFLNWPNFHSKESITNTVVYSVNSNYLFSRGKQEKKCWNNSLIKDRLSPSKQNCVIGFIESPLKIMKNALFRLKSSSDSQDI